MALQFMIKKWINNKAGSFPMGKVQFLKAGYSTDNDRLHLDVHKEVWLRYGQKKDNPAALNW